MSTPPPYVGRFAPSPTGPLHLGSLLAAMASYLEARCNKGSWLLRIDNIDPPREQAGAVDQIVSTLDRYGFEWDGPVHLQGDSREQHRDALQSLLSKRLAYACTCSRRYLANGKHTELGVVYPGHCRDQGYPINSDAAVRVRTDPGPIRFTDGLQGLQTVNLEQMSGDFVIWRRGGLVAYQLAVVVDDAIQNVTHIVRGIDLMPSTPRQIHLQRLLDLPTPEYAHIPVAVNADGSKLSKLTGACSLPPRHCARVLVKGLRALHQDPPESLAGAPLPTVWQWALENWRVERLQKLASIEPGGEATAKDQSQQ